MLLNIHLKIVSWWMELGLVTKTLMHHMGRPGYHPLFWLHIPLVLTLVRQWSWSENLGSHDLRGKPGLCSLNHCRHSGVNQQVGAHSLSPLRIYICYIDLYVFKHNSNRTAIMLYRPIVNVNQKCLTKPSKETIKGKKKKGLLFLPSETAMMFL